MKPSFEMRGECAFIFEDIIDKALSILNRQFNVDIRYIEKPLLVERDLYTAKIIENDLITYSVHFKEIFKGTLEFRFSRKLNLKEIKKVKDFLLLTIKAPAQYYERFLLIDELQIQLQKQADFDDGNIINFNYFKHLKSKEKGITGPFDKVKKSHPPIYIEGTQVDDKRNLAIELHYFLGYQAFVHFSDIADSVNSLHDISELSNATIFIEDLDLVSNEKKLLFLDFFTELNTQDKPLIISSSQTDYQILLKDTLNRTLLKFLSIHHIRLNKSLDKIKQEGFTTFLNTILKDPKFFTPQ